MSIYRFYRLVRKYQTGKGRRYYRLVSYPHDRADMGSTAAAVAYAKARRYAAILVAGGQWITLDDRAAQCVRWHTEGRPGYVK